MRCFRIRAGTAPISARWWRRNWRRIAAAEADKVEIDGPNVSLLPHMAQGLALALHELATNAAKHGALSSMAGKVSLTWQMRPDHLVLQWIESGGPRDRAAVGPQLRPEGDPRQHREPAWRQGDVRLGAARDAVHVVDPARAK